MAAIVNPLNLSDGSSLLEAAIGYLQEQLVPKNLIYDVKKPGTSRIAFKSFIESTSKIRLEPWQLHLAKRLEKLTEQKGQRILIHKPPQHGGSIIVSQRLPAYLIGNDPNIRCKVACYNIDKATEFTVINRNIMQSVEYISMFPDPECRIPVRANDNKFSTKARREFQDSQPSIMGLGLQTGFIGQGAELLIIDDPYASIKDANSIQTNKDIWNFWLGALGRIDDDTNVVVMFHRYHENDFVGRFIEEEGLQSTGGRWEYITYRAEWDGDTRPEVGGPDPMKRKKGEYLSPRKARQPNYYSVNKQNPREWLSMFQGKPSHEEGNFFAVNKMKVISFIPPDVKLVKVCSWWDIASSEDGDYTARVKMGLGDNNFIYVLDVLRIRKNTDDRNKAIRYTCRDDTREHRNIVIGFPQDPAAAGKDMMSSFRKLLIGYSLKFKNMGKRGNKEQRADPWSQYVNAGLVRLVEDRSLTEKDEKGKYISWVKDYIEEHRVFPGGPTTKDDQIDASADCFAELALEIDNSPGQSFDTVGLLPEEESKNDNVYKETEDELYQEYLLEKMELEEYSNLRGSNTNVNSHKFGKNNTPNNQKTWRFRRQIQRQSSTASTSRRAGLERPAFYR